MDEDLETLEIWEAERSAVVEALTAPGSKARNERGAMAVSKFKQIGKQIWHEQAKEIGRNTGPMKGRHGHE